jgi:hypothetical protein
LKSYYSIYDVDNFLIGLGPIALQSDEPVANDEPMDAPTPQIETPTNGLDYRMLVIVMGSISSFLLACFCIKKYKQANGDNIGSLLPEDSKLSESDERIENYR